jgi:hypothetical protein
MLIVVILSLSRKISCYFAVAFLDTLDFTTFVPPFSMANTDDILPRIVVFSALFFMAKTNVIYVYTFSGLSMALESLKSSRFRQLDRLMIRRRCYRSSKVKM